MALGPGQYDDVATRARAETGARGLVLIVCDGFMGDGFSAQLDAQAFAVLPGVLRQLADQIEADAAAARLSAPRN